MPVPGSLGVGTSPTPGSILVFPRLSRLCDFRILSEQVHSSEMPRVCFLEKGNQEERAVR